MTAAPSQLVLDLPHRPALGAEDFLVSDSNRAAVDLLDCWPAWPHWSAVVVGPAGSGKSHLVNVWRARSGATRLDAPALGEAAIVALERSGALAVEDIDRGIGDERALFHVLNLARQHRYTVLLTARAAPGQIAVAVPDLRSRLRALPVVAIAPPDEPLLRAMLVKLFADRQLVVEPHVIAFLALHMERSTEAAVSVVAEVDRLSLAAKRKVTRALAAAALGRAVEPEA